MLEVGNTYDLESISSVTGPELQRGGTAFTAGEYGSWTPIAAEQTATGYDVAWKLTGADEYTVWATDSHGNYLSNLIPHVAGNSTALESLETSFQQDLNNDGTTGIPASSGSHVAAPSLSAMMGESGNDHFVFRADLGAAPAVTYANKFKSHETSSTGDRNIAGLPGDAHDHWQTVQSAYDGPDPSGDHHNPAPASVHLADLHASHFIIH